MCYCFSRMNLLIISDCKWRLNHTSQEVSLSFELKKVCERTARLYFNRQHEERDEQVKILIVVRACGIGEGRTFFEIVKSELQNLNVPEKDIVKVKCPKRSDCQFRQIMVTIRINYRDLLPGEINFFVVVRWWTRTTPIKRRLEKSLKEFKFYVRNYKIEFLPIASFRETLTGFFRKVS